MNTEKTQKNTQSWWYIGTLLAVSLCGLIAVVMWGLNPRPIPKIKLSEFADSKVLSNSIFLRLNEELKGSSIWLLGAESEEDINIWQNFIQTYEENTQSSIEQKWVDERLVPSMKDSQASGSWVVKNLNERMYLIPEIEKSSDQQKRLVFLTTTTDCARSVERSFRNQLPEKLPLRAICASILPRNREQEKTWAIPCKPSDENDTTGLGRLGCLIYQSARPYYPKKQTPGARVGLMNQVGGQDYLLLHAVEQ